MIRSLLTLLPLTLLLACATNNNELGSNPPEEQQIVAAHDARAERSIEDEEKPSCATGCRQKARSVYTDCMAEADDADACRRRAGEWARECAAEKCGEGSAEGNGQDHQARCERRCGMGARKSYSECIETGGESETCRPAAGVMQQECVAEHCPKAP